MVLDYLFKKGSLLLLLLMCDLQLDARQVKDSITTISIKAIAGMQYDLVRFAVPPGAKVKITFSNTDDMSHNLLVTKPGSREQVVKAALQLEENGPAMDYIPNSSQVLWSIPVTDPVSPLCLYLPRPWLYYVWCYLCFSRWKNA